MQLPHEELKSLIVLNRLSLVGGKTVCGFLSEGMKPSEILSRIEQEDFLGKAAQLKKLLETFSPESEIEKCAGLGISILSFSDAGYPELLKQISDPPLVLYIKGNLMPGDDAAIAIVGTRHPSVYGINQTRKFASELAGQGITIVSGLAQGIDQAAHEACLTVPYGRTLAVLGCGLDVNYPSNAVKLRNEISERGVVISEYALGTPPLAENFPRRNRIISGLSFGVIVIEAHARSGSLITARMAMEQGREVFALPGPVDQLTSRGTHSLIKEGATLVEQPFDVTEMLASCFERVKDKKLNSGGLLPIGFEKSESRKAVSEERNSLNPEEGALYELLRIKPMACEEIIQEGNWLPEQLSFVLTLLEAKKKVKRNPDGRFAVASF